MKSTTIQRVIAGVIEQDGLFLIAQRSKRDDYYGLWEFPGGKVEAAETDQECLARELSEEFSIQADIGSFLCESTFVSGDKEVVLAAYRVVAHRGEFELREHLQLCWVKLQDLDAYTFPHPDLAIIQALCEEL